jgi:lysophospholipase L1-like esterase
MNPDQSYRVLPARATRDRAHCAGRYGLRIARRPLPPWRHRAPVAVVAALVVVLAACNPVPPLPDVGAQAPATSVPNRSPELQVPDEVRTLVGVASTTTLRAVDADGDPVVLQVEGVAPGLVVAAHQELGGGSGPDEDGAGTATSVLSWQAPAPGTWSVTVVGDDGRGGQVRREVTLVARHPANPSTVVAMGDSVASGHGLDRFDYLGRDRCWRAEGSAYPDRALERLVAAGRWPQDGRVVLVACSGARAGDLLASPVGGGPAAWAPPGTAALPQVDWAVRGNPGLVTVTVGANDLGFSSPWELIADGALDVAAVEARLGPLRAGLDEMLGRLLRETDAVVLVTGYYDPSSPHPQGVDGCRTSCFAAAASQALDRMNEVIAEAVAASGSPRARYVDLRAAFVGHGAPNGVGPDAARAGGLGILGAVIGPLASGTHPYCARGDTTGEPWINAVDCVHPDGRGHREIGALVAASLP